MVDEGETFHRMVYFHDKDHLRFRATGVTRRRFEGWATGSSVRDWAQYECGGIMDDRRLAVRALLGDQRGGGFRPLEENQRVEYEVTQDQKGPQASNIRPI